MSTTSDVSVRKSRKSKMSILDKFKAHPTKAITPAMRAIQGDVKALVSELTSTLCQGYDCGNIDNPIVPIIIFAEDTNCEVRLLNVADVDHHVMAGCAGGSAIFGEEDLERHYFLYVSGSPAVAIGRSKVDNGFGSCALSFSFTFDAQKLMQIKSGSKGIMVTVTVDDKIQTSQAFILVGTKKP